MDLTGLVTPTPLSLSSRPATTRMSPGCLPAVQWAAVTTLLSSTSAPPQNWNPSSVVRNTAYGWSAMLARLPPTICWPCWSALACVNPNATAAVASAAASRSRMTREVAPMCCLLTVGCP
jgi:hypothetical protein